MRIPSGKVKISPRYIVDCFVCHEGVDTDGEEITTLAEAEAVKQQHLEEHANGDWD
jgi:hypothetical protein